MNSVLKSYSYIIFGPVLMGLGIGLTITADFGSDPLAMLWLGISNHTCMSIGQANIFVSFVMLFYPLLYGKDQIGLGTVLSPFLIWLTLDLYMFINFEVTILLFRFIILILGFIVLSFGAALYINAEKGKSTYDASLLLLSVKFNKSMGTLRSVGDLVIFLLAMALEVPFSIAPLLSIFIVGPFIDIFLKMIK